MNNEARQQILWRLGHILDAIDETNEYLEGVSPKDFFASSVLQSAVRCKIQDIGEAANKILEADKDNDREFEKKHPKMPIRQAAGMRHKMVHGYMGINWDLVWDTARNQLPILRKLTQQAIAEIERNLPPN